MPFVYIKISSNRFLYLFNDSIFICTESGKCELFMYGGCAGNQNNFNSVEDCEKQCVV